MSAGQHSTETARPEGWAFLSPSGVGAHYFRDGKSFCGRPLPAGVEPRGDVFGAGSDPEECRRCTRRAHDEADALDAAEIALMDAEDEEADLSLPPGQCTDEDAR